MARRARYSACGSSQRRRPQSRHDVRLVVFVDPFAQTRSCGQASGSNLYDSSIKGYCHIVTDYARRMSLVGICSSVVEPGALFALLNGSHRKLQGGFGAAC